MAGNVVLFNRTQSKSLKIIMNDVNLTGKVKEFRSRVASLLDMPIHEIELIYCGQVFKDEKCLESYGLRCGSIVHILKKPDPEPQEMKPEPMDIASIQEVVTALQAALMNPAHRNTVESIISHPETIDSLIATTPGLDKDPIALAMLQDAELLAILADQDHIHRVIERHPCLGHAAMMVAAAVNEENIRQTSQTPSTSSASYSLDQMSDEDDDGERSAVLRPTSQPITTSQLAAALAAASGSTADQNQSSSNVRQGSRSVISPDFFHQAVIQSTGNTERTAGSTEEEYVVSEVALQQLYDMGITDETQARQALMMTSGDIEAALEILFGDGHS